MPAKQTLTWVALVLGIIWYRSAGLIKNCILVRSPLPTGYVAGGDYASQCTPLRDPTHILEESLNSCEDETFWELQDTKGKVVQRPVIVSCDPGRKSWNTVMGPLRNPDPHGALWLYVPESAGQSILSSSVATNKAHRISFKNYPPKHDFHPLGVAIWPSHAGNASNLYVVNHARANTVIEQFILDPAKPLEALHVRTIKSSFFLSPNALALTSPNSFYVTNDHLFTRRLPVLGHIIPIIESVLALPFAFVSHVTLNPSPIAKNPIARHAFAKMFIPFPNGIAVSHSGNEVALVSTSLSQIHFYERDPATNALVRRTRSVSVPFSPDNVHYSAGSKGGVVVAGHPNFPDLATVAANKKGATAGSWVVAIEPKDPSISSSPSSQFDLDPPVSASTKIKQDGQDWTLRTLFQSDGRENAGGFGGSSTGLVDPDSGAFYVSGLYSKDGAMVCRPASGKEP